MTRPQWNAQPEPCEPRGPAEAERSTQREGEMHVWTSTQLQCFLASLDGERLAPAFLLAAHTGMRRGEVVGLRWADVDLDAKLIHLRQNAVVSNYDARLTDVKTTHGRRTIDVNDDVVRALQGWRRKQAEERLLLAAGYDDHTSSFARADGALTHPELLSSTDRVIAHAAGCRGSGSTTSGTHATLLLKAGVPLKVVSERLGHATASFTLESTAGCWRGCRPRLRRCSHGWLASSTDHGEDHAKDA